MKTIEQKAKAYNEALAAAKHYYEELDSDTTKNVLEEIFPELKESEDEKIRKEIIEYIKTGTYHKSWLAWLEKQGEHANFRNKIQVGDNVTRNEDGVLVNLSQLKRVAKPEITDDCEVDSNEDGLVAETIKYKHEQQGEQKPADKVEPKFKIGDKIQYSKGCGTIMTIEKIENVRTNAFIKKACEWLKENITNNPNANSVLIRNGCVTLGMLIEDFKKYMEE